MVIIVPAFSKGQQTHQPFIAAAISGFKCTRSEGTTDRVHIPGDMVGK